MAANHLSNSGAIIARLMTYGDWRTAYIVNPFSSLGNSGFNHGSGYPNYVCQPGDNSCVQLTISCNGDKAGYCKGPSGDVNGLSVWWPKFGVPESNGSGNDMHESVLDCRSIAPSCREVDLNDFGTTHNPPSGGWSGTLNIGSGSYGDPINGSGWGDTSHGGTAVASGAMAFPAEIRSSEIANGINGIQHAIEIDVFCGTGKVYPATNPLSFDCKNSSGGIDNSNTATSGARFYWSDSCSTISGYPTDAWSKAVLCALHTYGGYAADTSDSTNIIFQDSEMQFGGGTGYTNYLEPWAQTYGTNLGNWSGADHWSAGFDNGGNGFNSAFVSARLFILNPCVNGLAGTQGSC
jgi:hypothetical protein